MRILERGKCTEMRNEGKCGSLGSRRTMTGTMSGTMSGTMCMQLMFENKKVACRV